MKLTQATRLRIISLLKKKNITEYKLSSLACISSTTLNNFLAGKNKDIKLTTLLHICEGFGITITDFFNDDIFLDVDED